MTSALERFQNYMLHNQFLPDCIQIIRQKAQLESSDEIEKAIVSTPTSPKTGKVDYESVKSGDSIWITVTNPESPLHGRPLLLTKRPDGLMAITGGAGFGARARRHMVLTGTPKKTKRDIELEQEIDDIHSFNDPLISERKKLEREAREDIKQASNQMLDALGIKKPDKKALLEQKDVIQNYFEDVLGEEGKEDAKRMTDAALRAMVAGEKKISERVQLERQVEIAKAKIGRRLGGFASEEPEPEVDLAQIEDSLNTYEPMTINLPDANELKDLTPSQQEDVIEKYVEKQADLYFEPDRDDHVVDNPEETPQIELGKTVEPLELKSRDDLQSAANSILSYWEKRKFAEATTRLLKKPKGAAPANATTLANLQDEIAAVGEQELSADELLDRIQGKYDNWMGQNSAIAFYDAVGQHWNDDQALTEWMSGDKSKQDSMMKFHVDNGAATAIAALAKEHLGTKLDTGRLIQNGNIELAASVLAYNVRTQQGMTATQYNNIIDNVGQHNAENQIDTERRALNRHQSLDRQYEEIQRQKGSGELVDEMRIAELELENVIEQRKNLGNAMGSLQASATFFDALERFKTGTETVSINVGSDLDVTHSIVGDLRLRPGQYSTDTSDLSNIKVNVDMRHLGKLVREEKSVEALNDRFDQIKTDMSGVSEDDGGNLVVDNYDVPFWKKEFSDESGDSHDYKWRVEQRNDINWLLEATKKGENNPLGQGGGLITRVVGAGKTNTSLGFFAHKLDENPDYKALIAVPKGRSQQWVEEAQKFSDLPIEHIPDGTSKAQVDDIMMNSKPGTIYVTGHREASRSHDVLTAMQTDSELGAKFHGITIDEPQEMTSGRSGNIGAMGKRLMKLPFDHRIGLTATPARSKPVEAFQMAKWVASDPRRLGSTASFQRMFQGFGGGTNTEDSAGAKALFQTISPYVSGDRITTPTFKVTRDRIDVKRTPAQIAKQREIESSSKGYIDRRSREIMQEVRENPNHTLRRTENWESRLPRNANETARKEVSQMHIENMHGGPWNDNSKMLALHDNLDRQKKHVVFIDSKVQRNSLVNMLKDMGYGQNQIKNIAGSTTSITGREMSARAKAFRGGQVPIIMIDKTSSSGYNLQAGDVLHVIGSPGDASEYLQSQGRIARMPRVGDVNIKTYTNEDNVEEQAHWNRLEAQVKLISATAPSMVV